MLIINKSCKKDKDNKKINLIKFIYVKKVKGFYYLYTSIVDGYSNNRLNKIAVSMGIKIECKYWNNKTKSIKSGHPNYYQLRSELNQKFDYIENLIFESILRTT